MTSSWTVDGVPVSFVPLTTETSADTSVNAGSPISVRPRFEAARLKNSAAIAPAFFHLEKIKGPVLFLSAGNDGAWNSTLQAQMGLAYLQKMHHPFADAAKDYPGAGHLFLFSFPGYPLVTSPFPGGATMREGGTPEINAAAGSDGRALVLEFLNTALATR